MIISNNLIPSAHHARIAYLLRNGRRTEALALLARVEPIAKSMDAGERDHADYVERYE